MRLASSHDGFSLLEMMIGIFLSALLISGITALLSGSVSAYRLQLGHGQLEESARYALDVVNSHIAQAGYRPEPWRASQDITALTEESRDGGDVPGDQLGLQRWSMRNCYGNENPVRGGDGQAVFHLLKVRFRVNAGNSLTFSCRYGPDASRLRTQINNFALIGNIESMQVLYAADSNGDAIADNWVRAQDWHSESEIRAVKVAFLLSTAQPVAQTNERQLMLLDEPITAPADGRLRRVSTLFTAIRGRRR
jgi:prepilin-type N-terminal cleavage/methylation domain-containing protein